MRWPGWYTVHHSKFWEPLIGWARFSSWSLLRRCRTLCFHSLSPIGLILCTAWGASFYLCPNSFLSSSQKIDSCFTSIHHVLDMFVPGQVFFQNYSEEFDRVFYLYFRFSDFQFDVLILCSMWENYSCSFCLRYLESPGITPCVKPVSIFLNNFGIIFSVWASFPNAAVVCEIDNFRPSSVSGRSFIKLGIISGWVPILEGFRFEWMTSDSSFPHETWTIYFLKKSLIHFSISFWIPSCLILWVSPSLQIRSKAFSKSMKDRPCFLCCGWTCESRPGCAWFGLCMPCFDGSRTGFY